MDLFGGGDQDDDNRKRTKLHMNENGDKIQKRVKRDGDASSNRNFLNHVHDEEEENSVLLELTLRCGPAEPPIGQRNHRQPPIRVRSSPEPSLPGTLELMPIWNWESTIGTVVDPPQETLELTPPGEGLLTSRSMVEPPRETLQLLPTWEDGLTLSSLVDPQPQPLPIPQPQQAAIEEDPVEEEEEIPAPYPWATTRHARVHSLEYLEAHGINTITGEVRCSRCDQTFEISYDLHEKFGEIKQFIHQNKDDLYNRAPNIWRFPKYPDCRYCMKEYGAVRPVISSNTTKVNWLFLLLGKMLANCTLNHLKYFCKFTSNHRTGAKDRLLYLVYLDLCKQLDPSGPFDR